MKTWNLTLAIALATIALVLLTGIVVAAPVATSGVSADRVYDNLNEVLTTTLPTTHPVGSAIATYFHIPYTQVMALHAEGFGFGTIARVYLTALASGGVLTPEQVLEMRQAGVGWGQIKQEYGVLPGGNGLGSIMGKKHVTLQPESGTAPAAVKPGNNGSTCPGNSCNAPGQQKKK